MIAAPDETYFIIKVATTFGSAGAFRWAEHTQVTVDSIEVKGNLIIVKITNFKNLSLISFVIS